MGTEGGGHGTSGGQDVAPNIKSILDNRYSRDVVDRNSVAIDADGACLLDSLVRSNINNEHNTLLKEPPQTLLSSDAVFFKYPQRISLLLFECIQIIFSCSIK